MPLEIMIPFYNEAQRAQQISLQRSASVMTRPIVVILSVMRETLTNGEE